MYLYLLSPEKLVKKVTLRAHVMLVIVLLVLNLVFCFGQLFVSPTTDSGCLAVSFLSHFTISALFTITTWFAFLILCELLDKADIKLAHRIKTFFTRSKFITGCEAGLVFLVSIFFPILFVSIGSAKSKNIMYGYGNSSLNYMNGEFISPIGGRVCFLDQAGNAYRTLMYGQWSVAMFVAVVTFFVILKNGLIFLKN